MPVLVWKSYLPQLPVSVYMFYILFLFFVYSVALPLVLWIDLLRVFPGMGSVTFICTFCLGFPHIWAADGLAFMGCMMN